ncbi:MAG: O-antigen ligase family protein [Brevundimonas sp.]
MLSESSVRLSSVDDARGKTRRFAGTPYGFSDPWLLSGAVVYSAGSLIDSATNIPIVDLLLPLLVLGVFLREGSLVSLTRLATFYLAAALVALVALSLFANAEAPGGAIRRLVVVATTFVPILLFRTLRRQQQVMSFVVGCVGGFCISFMIEVAIDLSDGGVSRSLRAIQPTPVVAVAVLLALRYELSPLVKRVLLVGAIATTAVAFAIEARAPVLALLTAIALWPFVSWTTFRVWVSPLLVGLGLAGHYVYGLSGSAYQAVLLSGRYSISNAERAYAIDLCTQLIRENPWLGVSAGAYPQLFAEGYSRMPGIWREAVGVLSPHNTFLEYAVFHGLPSAVLLTALIVGLFLAAARRGFLRPLVYALIVAGVIRLCAFYGISGWIRIEWFALMFLAFYRPIGAMDRGVAPAKGEAAAAWAT